MQPISECLRLLSDENRLRILHLLDHEPLTVAELQEALSLSQSSVSSHLGKLKRSGLLYDVAEGSAHRYRLREDLPKEAADCWHAVRGLTAGSPHVEDDRRRLSELRAQNRHSWVERVAGHLHREYAPGRSWDALGHTFLSALELGDCVDIGAGDGAMIDLLEASCRSLLCVDPSPAMVAAGEQRINDHTWQQVRYLQAAAEDLPLADSHYDTVLFIQSLQYVQNPAKALGAAFRILKPGGRLLCLTLCAHDFAEAERYGHRHFGFHPQQLKDWVQESGYPYHKVRCLPLTAESKPPRFTPLLLTVCKGP